VAFVVCQKHGGHGAAAVCQHVLDAIVASLRVGPVVSLTVEFEGIRLGPIWFCAACASCHAIRPDGLLLTGESGLDRMYEIGWCPVCPVCFHEAGGPG
jgi:hypothetical protein